MGYLFHLGDKLSSALKSLKTYYICNCLVSLKIKIKNMCTAHVLICGCLADTYATSIQLNQECNYYECMYKKLSSNS